MTLDELRTSMPELGFALYAYEPSGPVTLEILAPDGQTFSFTGKTVSEAVAAAFPQPPPEEQAPTAPAPAETTATPASVFD